KGRKGMFFSEIQKNTFDKYGSKISSRVLSDCLQNLESDGLISRTVFNDAIPVRVEYSLTEKGYDFKVVLSALKGWGTKYGGLKQKLCLNFTCLHNAVPILNIDKAWDILDLKNDSTNESNSQD
ncbi:MAG: winged helix-turn-helix transcriptional regulator, partial [Candidatus Heimdallarchaeota archaeon]